MNVLLAEANVSYDLLVEPDDVNPTMDTFDVAVVIGANDVVNPQLLKSHGSLFTECPLSKFIMLRLFLCLKDQCHLALLESKIHCFLKKILGCSLAMQKSQLGQ